ncbi:hypothetical protein [Nostoc sp. 'Peltigera membranacea cyanobiont' N6]|uniref:hypothetical protein n=1 Tax=Nostoc sp. 'Peltigera membranacea cyanobiont' N6 TaxID=1261031 RepID=UPI000CF31B63|nr:hypothetical protein [Nostoc sp. 'Peltigera membranacea cyanobiont' N6]AVH63488.1 hypothetical protein NPM_1673 [Nostoc sp. 'Peltigera membranacea cyanobiont' N6]
MKFKTKLFGSIAVISSIFCSLLMTPAVVRANNDEYVNEVGIQLMKAIVNAGFGGYSPTHEPHIDTLYHDSSDYITINLRAGKSYGIVGVCDRDCQDLDIALYDDRGNLIASDLEDDDIPAIGVTPYRNGTYRVRIDMANCDSKLCYYGLGVFGQ